MRGGGGGIGIYRSVANFLGQFGYSGDKVLDEKWCSLHSAIRDERQPLQSRKLKTKAGTTGGASGSGGRPFVKGTVSFAGAGRHTRGCNLFFAYASLPHLGAKVQMCLRASLPAGGCLNTNTAMLFSLSLSLSLSHTLSLSLFKPWETPIGAVRSSSFAVLDALSTVYGDIPPWGKGPDPKLVRDQGNGYLHRDFPHLDFIRSCSVTRIA